METNQNKITLQEFQEKLAHLKEKTAKRKAAQRAQFNEAIKRMKENINKN